MTIKDIKAEDAKKRDTIRFSLRGQYFEVSRFLFEPHPETMLARLVSDTERLSNPNTTIFIDRDGERFKYVLDFLSYGKVSLPLTVSRDMFLLDMGYYGFQTLHDDAVRSTTLAYTSTSSDYNIVNDTSIIPFTLSSETETTENFIETIVLEQNTAYTNRVVCSFWDYMKSCIQ